MRAIGRKLAHLIARVPGRVEDWRGDVRLPVAVAVSFERHASVRFAIAPFPVPSASHAACGFPVTVA